MPFHAQLAAAAKQSQGIIAQFAPGVSATTKNFTLNGVSYQGVVVERQAIAEPTATGYETVRELSITATRAQFTAKPDAAPRLPVTALDTEWYLTAVGVGDLHYFLTCRLA